jgi:hypothetical protein
MRIARDLHDVVAHDISVINVQANTALHLMDRQPDRARSALSAINDVSKQALVELRASSAPGTAPSWSSSPIRQAWSGRGGPGDQPRPHWHLFYLEPQCVINTTKRIRVTSLALIYPDP